MKHNFIDRYAALDSPLHTLEARAKILGFLALLLAALWIPQGNGGAFLAMFFVAAILMGASQVPLQFVVGRALIAAPFVIFAALAAPFRNAHDALWLATLFFRSFLSLILIVLLTSTTPFPELLRGLRRLGCPKILVLNLSFLYRYLFVLTEEVLRMRQARDARRAGRMPIGQELRLLGSMLGTLLLRSFERAERMHQAMLARGYSGELPIYAARKTTWKEGAFLIAIGLIITIVFLYLS